MRRLALIAILLMCCNLPARSEIIDEVVAAVGNAPILRSDLALAEAVRLVEPVAGAPGDDRGSLLLDARIRLELQFRDLEGSGTLYRLDLDVGAVRDALVERAGGWEELEPRLEEHGLTRADVDELALRLAAVNAYVEQRLRPRVRITADEIRVAYEELAATARDEGAVPPPLDSVRNDLHRLLAERSLNDEIERWLESAAEQHEVTRFLRR